MIRKKSVFFSQVSAIKIHWHDITQFFPFWKHPEMVNTVKVLNSQAKTCWHYDGWLQLWHIIIGRSSVSRKPFDFQKFIFSTSPVHIRPPIWLHLGSSSRYGTVRFPRYQKIQNTRLRKMMIGPDRMKKSQKLIGAKRPMRKRISPTTSNRMAKKRKRKQRPTLSLQSILEKLR